MSAVRRHLLVCVAISIATACAFAPAFRADWVLWDDDQNFLNHSAWRGLSLEHLRWMFTTFHLGPYQPLAWVTLGLDHELWGMDARGYHATSVAIHALTACAFYFLARALLPAHTGGRSDTWRDVCAAAAALVFAIHPLRCESVAWITERRDVVAGFFLVLCVLAYVHASRASPRGRRAWFALALCLYAASLLAKGLGMMLPPVLVVLDVAVLRRTQPSSPNTRTVSSLVVEKLPFGALALAAAVLAWVGQSALSGTMLGLEDHPLSARLAQALYGLYFYVAKTVWPSDLVPLVPLPKPLDVLETRFVIAALAAVATGALLYALRRRAPLLVAAFSAYAILVLPVLGLTQTGPQLVADRYSYFSCMPFALLLGGALQRALNRTPERTGPWLAGVALVLAALGARCFDQTRTWSDTRALWERTVAVQPDNPLARRNLVVAYMSAAQAATDPLEQETILDQALEQCAIGIERSPDPAFLVNAASLFELRARQHPEQAAELLARAIDHAERAIELGVRLHEPQVAAYEILAVALSRAGRDAEALAPIERLLGIRPAEPNFLLMQGQALLRAGRAQDALAPLQRVLALAPDASMAWIELGTAQAELGQREAAIRSYRRGIELEQTFLGARSSASQELADWVAKLRELER